MPDQACIPTMSLGVCYWCDEAKQLQDGLCQDCRANLPEVLTVEDVAMVVADAREQANKRETRCH